MIWQTKKLPENGRGGDAGEIYIVSRKIAGNGSIHADGGSGNIGGKGGKVKIVSENNQFDGTVSVKGGKSLIQRKRWWETNWFQVIALLGGISGIISIFFIFK